MTPADIHALEQAALAATQGPWRFIERSRGDGKPSKDKAALPELVNDAGNSVCWFGYDLQYDNQAGNEPSAADQAFMAAANPSAVLELVRRLREAEANQPDVSNLDLSEGDTVIVKFPAGSLRAPDDWLREFDRVKRAMPDGCKVLFFTADFDVSKANEDSMRQAGWVSAEKLEQAEAALATAKDELGERTRGYESALKESRANEVAAMGWLADCRIASGDNGKRMLTEFVEYLRVLKGNSDQVGELQEALMKCHLKMAHRALQFRKQLEQLKEARIGEARYEKLRKLNAQQFAELYQRNIKGEGRFDDLVDGL